MRRLLLSLVLLLTVGAGCASAAVTFDTFGTAQSTLSPVNANYTVGASATALILDAMCMNTTAAAFPTGLSATYNSVALAQLGTTQNFTLTGNNRAQFSAWMTTAQPTTGAAQAFNFNFTASGYSCYVLVTSWIGASTSVPAGNFIAAHGSSTLSTVTLPNSAPSASNNAFSHSGNPTSAGTVNQTAIANDASGCCEGQSQRYDGTHGGLFTVSFTSRDWATDAFEICDATAGCSTGAAPACTDSHMLGVWRCDEER